MSNPRRSRANEDLRGVLAQQLSAAADDPMPEDRHAVSEPDGADADGLPADSGEVMFERLCAQDLQVDDLTALIRRMFDFEADRWLMERAMSPTSPSLH